MCVHVLSFTFLGGCMIEEISMVFQVLRVQDVAKWCSWIGSLHVTALTELDCKE